MLKRLKSALKSPKGLRFTLLVKAVVFAILLYFSNLSPAFFALFLAGAFYFYLEKPFNALRFLGSYLTLLISSLLATNPAQAEERFFLAVFFGSLFFLMLGIKDLVFIPRRIWYYALSGTLFALVFLIFFSASESWLFGVNYFILGLTVYFLTREFLAFNFDSPLTQSQGKPAAKKNLITLVFAFLILQFVWLAALLPIGFLSASALCLLFVLIMDDFALNNWSGTLTREIILRNITLFLTINLAIFGLSQWTL